MIPAGLDPGDPCSCAQLRLSQSLEGELQRVDLRGDGLEEVTAAGGSAVEASTGGVKSILISDVPAAAGLMAYQGVLGLKDGIRAIIGLKPTGKLTDVVVRLLHQGACTPAQIEDCIGRYQDAKDRRAEVLDAYFYAFDYYGKNPDGKEAFLTQVMMLAMAKSRLKDRESGDLAYLTRANEWQEFYDNLVVPIHRRGLRDAARKLLMEYAGGDAMVHEDLVFELCRICKPLTCEPIAALPAVPFEHDRKYVIRAQHTNKAMDVRGARHKSGTEGHPVGLPWWS
eukprot:Skav229125  [mRNA]  locus=scaffold2966:67063:68525:+ [translate_table: standard]